MKINAYLNFDGNCAEALNYYAKLLGGSVVMMMTYGDAPDSGQTSPEVKDQIIHGRIAMGDNVIMGSDCPPGYFSKPGGFCISISIEDPAEGERIFNGLADGGDVQMAYQETFWAVRFGMLTDRFGIPWMVNCEKPM